MDEELKRFLQDELKKEADEIMREVNNDSETANLEAPPELEKNLFARIEQYEKERAEKEKVLSKEDEELIRLGKIYKKKRKIEKFIVLVAAMAGVLAVGVTSFGGAERVFRDLHWKIGGREQTNMDSEGDDILEAKVVEEEDAYQRIKEEFGFDPVRMDYLPDGLSFDEATIINKLQNVNIMYKGGRDQMLSFRIDTNYKNGSTGLDIEDNLIEEFDMQVSNVNVSLKQYEVEGKGYDKLSAVFVYQNNQYFITGNDIDRQEFIKIIKNLHFF